MIIMVRLLSCFLVVLSLFSNAELNSTDARPNILLVLADDLGYGDLGSYGQTKIRTPNIDSLAESGVLFTQHYAGSTVCGPSRASLLTGFHTGHSPIRGNPKWTASGNPVEISPSYPSLGLVMQNAGYQTSLIGKWGMADGKEFNLDAMPNQNGFDFFYGYKTHLAAHHFYWHEMYRNNDKEIIQGNGYLTNTGVYTHDLFTDEALHYLDGVDASSPFFMMLSYTIPHKAITVPDDSKSQYLNLGWPERKLQTNGHYKNDPEGNVSYAGMVSRLDRDIGKLVSKLKSEGLYENTLIIFTSDNGHEYDNGFFDSNGPLKGMKRDLYEGGIRVPMIVLWPNAIKQGRKSEHVSAFWDYMDTFCEIAKTACPDSDGISFLPTLLGDKEQKKHEYLYWEFNEAKGPTQALRVEDYKLVKRYKMPIELYDLSRDISEESNLLATKTDSEYLEIAINMEKQLKEARTHNPEFILKKLPNPWKKTPK
ncbi:arylsulfatase [Thalassotalea euphylliae]|nr:arylsulfatase [Thalassotalea euphylliae]